MTGLFHIVERIHADHVVAVAPIFEGTRSTELSSSTIEIAKTARQVSAAGISATVFTFDTSGQLAEWVTAPDALTADGRTLHHALRSLLTDHQHRFFAIFEAITVVLTETTNAVTTICTGPSTGALLVADPIGIRRIASEFLKVGAALS